MAILRGMLRPIAHLAGSHARRQAAHFERAHRDTAGVQQRLLDELLRRHADTDFGRDHGFGSIRTYEQFRKATPVADYERFRPYVARMLQGRTEALVPPDDAVLMYSMTSGTTGEPKYIPVTRRSLADIRRGWNIFGIRVLRDHPAGWLRPILQISSSMRETTSPTGLPCGAVSGLLARTQKRIVRRMYVAPRRCADLHDPETKYYTLLRFAIAKDVGLITTANPSSVLRLFDAGRTHTDRLLRDVADGTFDPPGADPVLAELKRRFRPNPRLARRLEAAVARDGRLRGAHFWNPAFLTHWTGGTLGLYLPRLRQDVGDVPIRDIGLLASEGRFSIPLTDATAGGVAEITSNFLEFIPVGQRGGPTPEVLRAHELTEGGEYFLVFSNFSGLFRYNLDDRVRVVGFHGDSPIIEFLCRGVSTASITGEKITERQVVEAMERASRQEGRRCERFEVQGRFAGTPYYELRVESLPAEGPDGPNALAERFDAALRSINIEYEAKRASGRLGPVRATALAPGTLKRREAVQIARRHGRAEQYKPTYLRTDVLAATPPARSQQDAGPSR